MPSSTLRVNLEGDLDVGQFRDRNLFRDLDRLGLRQVALHFEPVRVTEPLRALEEALVALDLLEDDALHFHAFLEAEAQVEARAFRDPLERELAQIGAAAEEIDLALQQRERRGVDQVGDAEDEGHCLGHRLPGESRL